VASTRELRRRSDATVLGVSSIVAGLAAYAYVLLGTHEFGSDAFAPVGVLWSIWAAAAAVLTFPLQHWVIRELNVDPAGKRLGRELTFLGLGVLALAGVAGAACFGARHELFHRNSFVYPLLVAVIIVGSALVGISRGALAGRGRMPATAFSVGAENVLRVAAAGAFVAAGLGVEAFAAGLVAGFAVAFFWPGALRFPLGRRDGERTRFGRDFGGLLGASLIAQLLLSAGPVVVAVLGGADREVTAVFAVFALARAPTVVAGFVSMILTAEFSRWAVAGHDDRLRRVLTLTVVATVVTAAVTAFVAAVAGPRVVQMVFGPDVDAARIVVVSVGTGCALALGVLVLTLMLVAQQRSAAAFLCALIGVVAAAVVVVVGRASPPSAVGTALMVSQIATLVALVPLATPRHPRPGQALEPAAPLSSNS
jgi:O-antigen/teichoic acid export membrane protein